MLLYEFNYLNNCILTILWFLQQQAALMAAATAQGTYINPMAALAAGQLPHALNGMPNPVVPPTSGNLFRHLVLLKQETSLSFLQSKLFFTFSFSPVFTFIFHKDIPNPLKR